MIVFVAGMARAGSMWTYNITREIYRTGKFNVLPVLIPTDEVPLIKHALLSEVRDKEVYCIKTHGKLVNPLPTKHEVKVICNFRDVRDACLSYMRFMHCGFDKGLHNTKGMMDLTDYYLSTFKNNLLVVRYEDVITSPLRTVDKISEFLGISLSEIRKNQILKQYSKENVQKKLSELNDVKIDSTGQVRGAKHQSKFDSAINMDGTYRAYDKSTAFQTNHITSKKDGEWKSVFNDAEIQELNSICHAWLVKYGYTV